MDPGSRGFGFAVLESPAMLVDWGIKSTRDEKESKTVRKVTDLIVRYRPEVMIVEDCMSDASRRCERIGQLLAVLNSLANERGIRSYSFSIEHIKAVFGTFGAKTKHEIAHVVAQQLPDLAPWMPQYRKPWMSEDYRMAMFRAAALALTFYYSRGIRNRRKSQAQ